MIIDMAISDEKILVVGQGLAGTLLSANLLQRGIDHSIVDNNHNTSSTLAAAGLINPITGRRYVKSWMIDELIESAIKTYQHLEALLDIHLINEREIIRSIQNPGQENDWESSTARPGYSEFTNDRKDAGDYNGVVNPAFQYRGIVNAYQINIADLIVAYRSFAKASGILIESKFDSSDQNLGQTPFYFNGKQFTKVIFCEGYQMMSNPFF